MSEYNIRRVHEEGHCRKFLVIVDESAECDASVYFSAWRARNTGSKIVMLFVSEPEEFQHWLRVEQIHREENEQTAAAVFRLYRRKLNNWGLDDVETEEVMRHGDITEEIVATINEDADISFLVLGASTSAEGPGRLVSSLAGSQAGTFPVPIVVIPGGLSLEEIQALA